ncbi:hypothetical protein P154DRAFT_496054 [Amniculicola lignicola CBS 123094]|uniref:Zinc finger C2H2 LYAR-type domain-containing protein n=1 Tax=Amniculicola lignicola CBS 123094 TaxID=1392246 RepID=A0A6A5WAB0_9PLEO|nr:hypothetical protein P154DRAFT_496054 [Amniculicola lignicola CBS 123094]
MVSFSCENCGDVLTKKKLDSHRGQCYGASFTCLDCMVHFEGAGYRSHTSCITEDQKYQGKLYKDKKAPRPQHHKKDSAQQDSLQASSQAIVPRNAYVEDAPDADADADAGAVAIVDAPPRAPSPPPAPYSLGYDYHEPAALPPMNVFDFLEGSETPNVSRVHLPADESRMIEDSIPPAYQEEAPTPAATPAPTPAISDVLKFQVEAEDDYQENGFAYGEEPVRQSNEAYDSYYNLREQAPSYNDPAYTTPAPKSKHSKTKSRDIETTTKKTDRKRKRNSPAELDLSLVRIPREEDTGMSDAPPMLHSGLTGGLNRLLARPEFPPSPELSGDYVENSPLSPMKRAKQGSSKALARAQREWEIMQQKEHKANVREETEREREERKERGRERERKPRKVVSTALVKVRPKVKKRDDSARQSRKNRDSDRRRRQYSSSPSPPPRERKTMKAIEYHHSASQSPERDVNKNGALIVRANGEVAPNHSGEEARAELFMSFVTKGPESERGMSVNKALKRYHRERYDRADRKGDEEKELWKSLRLKRNDRGEIVLFFAPPDGQ